MYQTVKGWLRTEGQVFVNEDGQEILKEEPGYHFDEEHLKMPDRCHRGGNTRQYYHASHRF